MSDKFITPDSIGLYLEMLKNSQKSLEIVVSDKQLVLKRLSEATLKLMVAHQKLDIAMDALNCISEREFDTNWNNAPNIAKTAIKQINDIREPKREQ